MIRMKLLYEKHSGKDREYDKGTVLLSAFKPPYKTRNLLRIIKSKYCYETFYCDSVVG